MRSQCVSEQNPKGSTGPRQILGLPAAAFRPLLVGLLLTLTGCTGSSIPEESAPPVLTAIDEARREAEDAKFKAQVAAARENQQSASPSAEPVAEPLDVPTTGTYKVQFQTTVGEFVVQVHRDWAPRGAERFYQLVKDGYYNDAGFFRVVPGFMVQFGLAADPLLTAKWDRDIKDDPVIKSNQRGYVTFAKTGMPDSRSTQVFINYGDNKFLDSQDFAPFGQVIKGMNVVEKINSEYGEQPDQGRLTSQGNAYLKSAFPNLDYIQSATVIEDSAAAEQPAATDDSAGN